MKHISRRGWVVTVIRPFSSRFVSERSQQLGRGV